MTAQSLLLIAAAALLSATLIWLRLRLAASRGLAHPDHRSLHARPTPHGGGIGIIGAALACGLWLPLPAWPLAGCLLLAALSWIDDWHPLPFWARLPLHLLLAAWVTTQILGDTPAWLLAGLTLALGWFINAYNFMDGADGLAGSMSALGFSAYAAAFLLGGDTTLALWSACIAAAALAFLIFNWHPAKIFMGDVGSIPLGFLAGTLGLAGWGQGIWPAWFPVLVFAPFLLDASFTLARRALAGKPVWQAHREHLYQRMVRAGLGHAGMCARWLPLMTAGGLLALAGLFLPGWAGYALAAAWLAALMAFGARVDAGLRQRGDLAS